MAIKAEAKRKVDPLVFKLSQVAESFVTIERTRMGVVESHAC